MRLWWKQRTWAAKIALVAALLTSLLFGAAMASTWLQEAFVPGYTPPDLLSSDDTAWDEVAWDALGLGLVTLLVSLGSALVAGLLGAARAVRRKADRRPSA
jgi:hypothetical protein